MSIVDASERLHDGFTALGSGDWEAARAAFEEVVDVNESPEAFDGLGRALWWLRDAENAVVWRERAYAGFRRDGELARAARIALWLSREYAVVWGNEAASRGWLARAERLLVDVAPGTEQGWLDLARSESARDLAESAALAERALQVAAREGDTDLELRALAQLGIAEVSLGKVDEGLTRLDEAMAAATAGEPTSLETFADVCCTLVHACELAGDEQRPKQWSHVFDAFVRAYDYVPLLAFCRTCCADVYAATGRIDDAEEELLAALHELRAAGQRARCVHPAARLAEIRVLQGRLDEAEQLLDGFEHEPESVSAAVSLRLARDEAHAAQALLERRLDDIGRTNLLSVPLLAQLVETSLACDDQAEAARAAAELHSLAVSTERERVVAAARLAKGRVAAAAGDHEAARLLGDAVALFARLGLLLDAARARVELARALAASARERAIDEGRRARRELEKLGASRDADVASALLRTLGAPGRAGPRALGALSRRETEVLRLLGEGLSNAEIAKRLFISPKTAEHHVGRILSKLELRSRAEAAAYAVRNLGPE